MALRFQFHHHASSKKLVVSNKSFESNIVWTRVLACRDSRSGETHNGRKAQRRSICQEP
jgi:hypothetical protein